MKTILRTRKIHLLLLLCILSSILPVSADTGQISDSQFENHNFTVQNKIYVPSFQCYFYYFVHKQTGASIVFQDNKDVNKNFAITFASSASNDKGANHVLEHALLSGTQTYPAKNLFYTLQGNSPATTLNGFTIDDAVSYIFETKYTKDYNNLLNLYLDMVFNPLIKTEKNLFLREGIRREYKDGKASYNGVVYNEVRARSDILSEAQIAGLKILFPDSLPGYDSGGNPEALKDLTYEEVMDIYNTYYNAENCLVWLSGDIDLDASLSTLDRYFSQSTKKSPKHSYDVSPVLPEQKQLSGQSHFFGADASSCISLTSVGPKIKDTKDYITASMLFDTLIEDLYTQFPQLYFGSSDGNGVMTSSILLENTTDGQPEQLMNAYYDSCRKLKGLSKDSITDLVRNYQKQQDSSELLPLLAIRGFLYTGDPLEFLNPDWYDTLCQENNTYFDQILDRYFINNPYQVLLTYHPNPDITAPIGNEIQASPEELQTIQRESAAYEVWASTPDSQEILNRVPKLAPEDFVQLPYDFKTEQENVSGIPYVHTQTTLPQKKESVVLSFDLSALNTRQIGTAQMASQVLSILLREQGVTGVWFSVSSNPGRYDGDQFHPTLSIHIDAGRQDLLDSVTTVKDILSDPKFFTAEAIEPMLSNLYFGSRQTADMYYFYDLWNGEYSKGHLWNQLAPGASSAGNYTYYQYMRDLWENGIASSQEDLRAVKETVFNKNCFTLFFQGSTDTQMQLREQIPSIASALSAQAVSPGSLTLPPKKNSVNLVDNTNNVAAVYQIGNMKEAGMPYCGQMQVMAKVLTTNYLLPKLRGSGGAYGAEAIIFSDGGFCANAARVPEISSVLQTFEGMGSFLRTLSLTDTELDRFIISAVSELDEEFIQWSSNFGYNAAVSSYTFEDIVQQRQEILSTTLEDLRSFADAIDHIIAEKRTFIKANQTQIDQSGVTAAVTENMQDLFKDSVQPEETLHKSYIFGKENGLFEPDSLLTQAEAAVLVSRVLEENTDSSPAPFTDIDPNAWYAEAVFKMYHAGIMQGCGDGSFCPDDTITGEQFALIASRTGGLPKDFTAPSGAVTRAEAVQIINAILRRSYGAQTSGMASAVSFSDVPPEHPAYYDIMEAATSHTCKVAEGTETWISITQS